MLRPLDRPCIAGGISRSSAGPELNRFIASATPIVAIISTASAAMSTASLEELALLIPAAVGRGPPRCACRGAFRSLSGPARILVVEMWWIDLSPLWPAVPPHLILTRPAGRSSLVVDHDEIGQVVDPVAAHERAHSQARIVHVGQRERRTNLRPPNAGSAARA